MGPSHVGQSTVLHIIHIDLRANMHLIQVVFQGYVATIGSVDMNLSDLFFRTFEIVLSLRNG